MIEPAASRPRAITLGTDRGYGAADFVEELHTLDMRPNVAQNVSRRRSAVDRRTWRRLVYAAGLRVRRRIEYLLHQSLSQLSNHREDEHGGSLENRLRFPLEVFDAARAAFPANRGVTMRVSATDWIEGGWDIAATIAFAQALETRGCASIHVSSGGLDARGAPVTTITIDRADDVTAPASTRGWGAVCAMTLCTFVLVASEFMPVSLLSPIANGLHLTTGQAGQAISISGLTAMIASLSIGRLINDVDRRTVLLGLTALLIVSGVLVAYAPRYAVLMVGRAVLGIAIGGFWSLSAAIAMRLVPPHAVPKALAMLNGGNALATVIGAPLGSFLGGLIGWRLALFCVVPPAVAATAWQALALPALPALRRDGGGGMAALLRRKTVLLGLTGAALLFMGQFALYTYLRPFLEQVTHVGPGTLSSLLLVVGVAGFAGTTLIGRLIGKRLHVLLAAMPAIMAAAAVGLALFGHLLIGVAVLLAIWGLIGTAAPVGWWTLVTRAAPDHAEAGGGLMVAVVQFAIMSGATVGGLAYDAAGPTIEFLGSAAVLALAALVALTCNTEGSPLRRQANP